MNYCDAKSLLTEKKLKHTKNRISVLNFILRSKTPVSAIQLQNNIEEIDKATIYRTLNILRDNEIIRELPAESGAAHYEKACVHNPVHPHFQCTDCGRLSCLTPLSFDDSVRISKMAEGNKISSVNIIIKGTCEDCTADGD